MKKNTVLLLIPLILLVAGCGSNKIDIMDTNIDVESCDKYFKMMECILENDRDSDYTEEDRDGIRQTIKDMQAEWEWLDPEVLSEKCSIELAKYEGIQDRLEAIWCSAK